MIISGFLQQHSEHNFFMPSWYDKQWDKIASILMDFDAFNNS